MDRHKDTLPHLLPPCKKGHFFPLYTAATTKEFKQWNMQLWIETFIVASLELIHYINARKKGYL